MAVCTGLYHQPHHLKRFRQLYLLFFLFAPRKSRELIYSQFLSEIIKWKGFGMETRRDESSSQVCSGCFEREAVYFAVDGAFCNPHTTNPLPPYSSFPENSSSISKKESAFWPVVAIEFCQTEAFDLSIDHHSFTMNKKKKMKKEILSNVLTK